MMWISADTEPADSYAAFRGRFVLDQQGEVEIHLLGASWFVAWLDGQHLTEGPARFPPDHPEYEVRRVPLPAGPHVLAVQVHYEGVTTRMLQDIRPFLLCRVRANDCDVLMTWKGLRLEGYAQQVRRINPQLGWIEWCDTRQQPGQWRELDFEDRDWPEPVPVARQIGPPEPLDLGPVRQFVHQLIPAGQGRLAERFGYERDDIGARFYLRDLVADRVPPQGMWRRYDLGRVRLGRPRIALDLPAGAVVELAYGEELILGRVPPYINLSAGPSCQVDHYVARGGVQQFGPLTPRGGRFVEIHVLADPAAIRFVKEEYLERGYHDEAEGSFLSSDPLLNRIWTTGVETLRACAEDAITDNPTRERGQWTGDVVSVGMGITAVAYGDLRLCRRGLMQSAWSAREDGMVAGLCPGGPAYLPTYAAQWTDACVRYYELTGDRGLLERMYPHAVRNFAAFEPFVRPEGLVDGAGWVFVDWGYVRDEGPIDVGMNLHYLSALRAMVRWCELLDKPDDRAAYEKRAEQIEGVLRAWLTGREWDQVGYHNAMLAMRLRLVAEADRAAGIAYAKRHILNCFPNNPDAPRLSDPAAANRQLITPYFAHYAFPVLIEHGEMDFVLEQYRKCWGWLLEDGRTTWLEVFDPRWSHCHQWAGCPTWQLSRYVLGLHARHDLGTDHYSFDFRPGSLDWAEGSLPLVAGRGLIRIRWRRDQEGIRYRIRTSAPIHLILPPAAPDQEPQILHIERQHEMVVDTGAAR